MDGIHLEISPSRDLFICRTSKSSASDPQIRGMSGFRNILVYRYIDIDSDQVFEGFHRSMKVFSWFAREILSWLDASGA
jgi:uncharacterized protein YutE (UPF0331/DUF86 family)